MDLAGLSKLLGEAAALPPANQNGMRISLPGVVSHARRALAEMACPLEDAPEQVAEQFDDRLHSTQPMFHAYSLEVLAGHLDQLKAAVAAGDAKVVREFFDLYVFD